MRESAAEFEISKCLDPAGKLLRPLPEALAARENIVELYRVMLLTRLFDRAAINLQRTGMIGTYASTEGQEAIGAGIGFAMREDDLLVPYYRDTATQIQRGVRLEELLLYWGGDEWGMHFENQAQDFPLSVPIATQACHAAGIAYAFKYRQEPRVAVTTCGDGATSKGDFYESINIAGAMGLPVVFVVNNNKWAISVPLEKQTAAETIAHKALAAGIDGYRVDGNDAIAMVQVMTEALDKAREAHRPCIVEALSYRLCDHTTADDASRYRPQQELDEARELEPLIRIGSYLQHEQDWSDADDETLRAGCEEQVRAAVENYQAHTDQPLGEFFDYMFEKPTAELERQKQELLEEARRHG